MGSIIFEASFRGRTIRRTLGDFSELRGAVAQVLNELVAGQELRIVVRPSDATNPPEVRPAIEAPSPDDAEFIEFEDRFLGRFEAAYFRSSVGIDQTIRFAESPNVIEL